MSARAARPYADPYLAGIALGLVLLAAYVLVGRGLGASGAFSSTVTAVVRAAGYGHTARNAAYAAYLPADGASPMRDWLVLEIAGVIIGGFLSAWQAGRLRLAIDRGPRSTDRSRLVYALAGGTIMGLGARFARGCTSGQALTGGALLSVGSWLFIIATFAAAFAVAPFLRRQWT